jgi:hypothetical protein
MAQIQVKKPASKSVKPFLKDYQTTQMNGRFTIDVQPSPSFQELSDVKKRLIQTIWNQEQKRRGGMLHEGAILSAVAYDDKKLTGHFVPYKYFLAQLCDPSLKPDLKIVPVSMSAITLVNDNIVLARRAMWVSQHPDRFELAPAGGVSLPPAGQSGVDLKEQLLSELVEEVGAERGQVKGVKFFTLIRDLKADAIELCAEIQLKPCTILSSSPEYTQIMTIPLEEITAFAKAHAIDFVPLSLVLLQLRKFIETP